ncbi:MAG: hypothetical protein Q8R78_03400 [Candidatus Omnitrophota bacterium]|nr:hypothetical protein [Candidatus Omnitrophota bacterium]
MSFQPMVAASLIARRFRRGGPLAHYLSIHTPDNSRQRYVRKSELDRFRRRTQAYRECVRALAEWVRVSKSIARELRSVRKLRCEKIEFPKSKRR